MRLTSIGARRDSRPPRPYRYRQPCKKMATGEKATSQEVMAHVGKLAWTSKAYPPVTPFLQPIYAWSEKIKDLKPKYSAQPGEMVKFVNAMIMATMKLPRKQIFPEVDEAAIFGATDAQPRIRRAFPKQASVDGIRDIRHQTRTRCFGSTWTSRRRSTHGYLRSRTLKEELQHSSCSEPSG